MRKLLFAFVLCLSACEDIPHPLDCATGFVAWSNCPPGSKGYFLYQNSLASKQGNASQVAKDPNDAADDATCKSYSTVPGTDAYVNCRIKVRGARTSPVTPKT